jgi:hypothetical protein
MPKAKTTKKVEEEVKVAPEATPAPTPEETRVQNVEEVKVAEERLAKLLAISAELNIEGVGTSPELTREIEKAKLNLDERKKLAGV